MSKLPDEWKRRSEALFQEGRIEEAITCCDEALEINPGDAAAWNAKGYLLRKLNQEREALKCFNKALKINPQYAPAWFNKGNALAGFGRYQEALDFYDKAVENDRFYADAWCNKGDLLNRLGRHEEALMACTRCLEIKPQDEHAWYTKGSTLIFLGRLEEATVCFDKALEINPRQADAWFCKGEILRVTNHRQDAMTCYIQALSVEPNFKQAIERMIELTAGEEQSEEVALCHSGDETNGHVMARHDKLIRVTRNFGTTIYPLIPANSRCWRVSVQSDSAKGAAYFLEVEKGKLVLFYQKSDAICSDSGPEFSFPRRSEKALLIDEKYVKIVTGAKRGLFGKVSLLINEQECVFDSNNIFGYGVRILHGSLPCYVIIPKHALEDGAVIDVLADGKGCDVEPLKGFLGWRWDIKVYAYCYEPVQSRKSKR